MVKKIFKYFFISLVSLLLLIVVGVFVLLKWPEILINERVLSKLTREYGPRFGIELNWEQADISVVSKSLLDKSFHFSFEKFCFDLFKGQYEGCADQVQLVGELAWKKGGLKILALGPVLIENGQATLKLPKTTPKAQKPFSLEIPVPELIIPDTLRSTRFGKIQIDLRTLKILQEDNTLFQGSLSVAGQPTPEARLQKIDVSIGVEQATALQSGKLEASLQSHSAFAENDWKLSGQAGLQFNRGTQLETQLSLYPENSEQYTLAAQGNFSDTKAQGSYTLRGQLANYEFQANLSADLKGVRPEINQVALNNCQLKLKQINPKRAQARLSLDCPARVDLEKIRLPNATWEHYMKVPLHAELRIKTDLETSLFFNLEQAVKGTLELELNTIAQHLLNLEGKTRTRFFGIPKQYPKNWDLVTEAKIKLLLKDFQRLKELLDHSAIAIWAPANVLSGSAEVEVDGKVDIAGAQGKAPIKFKTRLKSKEQIVNSDGAGTLFFQWEGKSSQNKLTLDLLLTELKVALPNISLSAATSLPALFPDDRFKDSQKHKSIPKKKNTFDYEITIKTPENKPALLGTNLARANIPVSLDLLLNPGKLDGTIELGKTDFEIFRRVAQLQKLEIDLAQPKEKSTVDGVIGVSYADYDIRILILGSVKKPNILFESDPPLDRDQIISLLIYGRTFEELNEDDSKSVGAVSAAVADRALALASLYFLASTPIENIAYDPESGEVSARIKVADGSSLTVGTQGGETQKAGFRQRIGANWSINSFLENNSETGEQSAGALIEWYKRY